MDEKRHIVKKLKVSAEERLVMRFPYNLLIRCWSFLRYAEERPWDFHVEFSEYMTQTGESTMDFVHFDKIPLTDDGKYLISLSVENGFVIDFCLLINPPYEDPQNYFD